MADPFTSKDQEIFRNGEYFAVCRNEVEAAAVTIMLNKGRLFASDIGQEELEQVRGALWS